MTEGYVGPADVESRNAKTGRTIPAKQRTRQMMTMAKDARLRPIQMSVNKNRSESKSKYNGEGNILQPINKNRQRQERVRIEERTNG
jgi:hypothetical protein